MHSLMSKPVPWTHQLDTSEAADTKNGHRDEVLILDILPPSAGASVADAHISLRQCTGSTL